MYLVLLCLVYIYTSECRNCEWKPRRKFGAFLNRPRQGNRYVSRKEALIVFENLEINVGSLVGQGVSRIGEVIESESSIEWIWICVIIGRSTVPESNHS